MREKERERVCACVFVCDREGERKSERGKGKESFWSFFEYFFIILCDENGFDTKHIISAEKEEKLSSSSFNKKGKKMAWTEKIGLIKTKKKKKKKVFQFKFWKWKFYTFIKIDDIHSSSWPFGSQISNFCWKFIFSNFILYNQNKSFLFALKQI